jgi:hypothetical protein
MTKIISVTNATLNTLTFSSSKEDVLELMYFIVKPFSLTKVGSKEEYKKHLIEGNENNP